MFRRLFVRTLSQFYAWNKGSNMEGRFQSIAFWGEVCFPGLTLPLEADRLSKRQKQAGGQRKLSLLMGGGIETWARLKTTEDKMVGQHHRLDGHEFEQAPGVGDRQGGLLCCSPWGRRVGHDWTELIVWSYHPLPYFWRFVTLDKSFNLRFSEFSDFTMEHQLL